MRRKIVAGNWKMNMSSDKANDFITRLNKADWPEDVEAIIAPPSVYLKQVADQADWVKVSAQNCHSADSGAYTGEISATMLSDIGATYCLVGHSERREYFKEEGTFLKEKVNALLSKHITPIYCCGETQVQRENGEHYPVIETQVSDLFHLNGDQINEVVIAYEPVWAIGTGLTATAEEAQDMHQHIRQTLAKQYGDEVARGISILYGGSCKPSNAKELFAGEDVDGGLIGGASLEVDSFVAIAHSF